jgi:hypothetical protein
MRVAAIPALPRRFANLSSHRRVSKGTRILKVAVADMCEKYKMYLPLSSLHFFAFSRFFAAKNFKPQPSAGAGAR